MRKHSQAESLIHLSYNQNIRFIVRLEKSDILANYLDTLVIYTIQKRISISIFPKHYCVFRIPNNFYGDQSGYFYRYLIVKRCQYNVLGFPYIVIYMSTNFAIIEHGSV